MKNLVNFSHPLSVAAKAALEEMVGDSVQEFVIQCQIDFDQPVKPQLDALVKQVDVVLRGEPAILRYMHLYIPPSISYAAAYVTARLSFAQSDAMPPDPPDMVVLKRSGGAVPQFIPCEIVRG